MNPVALRQVEPIGTIQTWESETSFPDETPFISDLGWARQQPSPRAPTWVRGDLFTDPTPLATALGVHTLGDQMGHVWMPWSFFPSATPDVAISGFGTDLMAAVVEPTISVGDFEGTTVFPASGLLRLVGPAQICAETTPLWEEAGEIVLLVPGLLPRTLRVRETGDVLPATTDPRTAEALAAIADVGRWLDRSQKDVAELCRFSLRASRYWGSGKTASPRPSTVRHLYEVHSFLGSLVRSMGRQRARDWLAQPSETGDVRLDVLAQENGVKALLRQAGAVIFAESPEAERPLPEPVAAGEIDLEPEPYAPAPHHGPPRRARRAPQRGG
jgi:hypothetical protein